MPAFAADEAKTIEPAAWGSDHVGQPLPEYVTGDECLFCHRDEAKWSSNRHQLTLRLADTEPPLIDLLRSTKDLEPLAKEVELLLGGPRAVRFLKKSREYGKLDLLSVKAVPARDGNAAHVEHADSPHWDPKTFGTSCAGCHTTAVDPATHAFSALSLDCYACHGHADLAHSDDPSLMLLSKKRNDPPRVVISICGQCHLRGGKSQSAGLPYPNNFVAGDNLFRDFAVDFSNEHLANLNPADRHVYENARDVVIRGQERVTCLSCHNVHQQSSAKHIRVRNAAICTNCHNPAGPKSAVKRYNIHSATCAY
jgi:predicted CXXCH cytochrome family protein